MNVSIQNITLEMAGKRELRLFALDNGNVIGICSVGTFGKVASTIYQLFVTEAQRGKGIGTALVREACARSKNAGASAISAIIEPGGPNGFWAASGFKPAHVDGQNLLVVHHFQETKEG